MTPETPPFLRFALLFSASAAALVGGVACDAVKEVVESVSGAQVPTASLARVDLVDNPSANRIMDWACFEYFGDFYCSAFGLSEPTDKQLRFSFDVVFDLVWSNPPIRIGKQALHELLERWLSRLAPAGEAVLVVQRHLGSDSLQRWLEAQGWPTERVASRQGYRLLRVRPSEVDR